MEIDLIMQRRQHCILIENYGISTVPWDDNGSFLRFGAVFESMNDQDDDRVLNILFERLSKANLTFKLNIIRYEIVYNLLFLISLIFLSPKFIRRMIRRGGYSKIFYNVFLYMEK